MTKLQQEKTTTETFHQNASYLYTVCIKTEKHLTFKQNKRKKYIRHLIYVYMTHVKYISVNNLSRLYYIILVMYMSKLMYTQRECDPCET